MAPKKRAKAKAKAKVKAKGKAKGSPRKPAPEPLDEEDLALETEAPEAPDEGQPQASEAAEGQGHIDEELPRFEDEDDMPVLNLVTSKAEPAASLKRSREEAGVDLTEDGDGEGDVWQQLENELQAPLNLPLAWPAADDASKPREPVVHAVDDKEDSDDDWGYIWKQSGVDAKQTSNILEEIEKNVKAAADFHKEKWQKKEQPEEEEAQEDEEWGAELYETQQEKEISKDFWVPDESWSAWECNSKEAVAAQRLVQKIRSRAAKKDTKAEENTELEDFPSEVLLEVLKLWIGRELPEQRMLLAMLLWVEAITVEVPIVRPDLNQYAMQLLSKEEFQVALRSACDHVSHDVLLVKAGAPIPAAALRNDEAPKVQKRLISSLSGMMQHAEFPMEEDDLTSKFEEIFADLPLSLRVASLAHLNEMAELLKELWASKGEFIEEMKKLASFDRACEVTCRLTLTHAVELGNQALNKDFKDLRVCKVDSLNRLGTEWRIVPLQEHLMQLHTLTIQRQLQIMLSIERDIEIKWSGLSMKVRAPEECSRQIRAYLNFRDRLRPYLLEEDLLVGGKQARDLQTESGMSLETKDLAGVRQGVTEVLKKLKQRYQWKPNMTSRVEISRVNWVARLSAVIRLAMKTSCLFADQELRQLLREDEKRKLGKEVFDQYRQWYKLERGDGMAIKGVKVAPPDVVAKIRKKYEDFGQFVNQQPRFQPSTPAGLGAAMTPGVAGGMTPGLNPGTPGLAGNLTPGGNRTPFHMPEYASGFEKSEGNTPQWKPPPETPTGPMHGMPSAGTPPFQARASGTPAGPPPPTPAQGVKGSMTPPGLAGPAASTPNINPFTPGGAAGAGVGGAGAPSTPFGAFAAPFTPAQAQPFTPAGAPLTPGAPPRTPSNLPGSANAPTTPVAAQKDEKSVKTESA